MVAQKSLCQSSILMKSFSFIEFWLQQQKYSEENSCRATYVSQFCPSTFSLHLQFPVSDMQSGRLFELPAARHWHGLKTQSPRSACKQGHAFTHHAQYINIIYYKCVEHMILMTNNDTKQLNKDHVYSFF